MVSGISTSRSLLIVHHHLYLSFVRKTHHSDHVLAMLMMRNPWLLEGSKCLPSPGAYFFFLLLPSLPGRKNQQSSSIADCLRLMWS